MKLAYSPASPFARKVRITAIELGLIDKIEFVPTKAIPVTENGEYARKVSPLRKIPALILDDGNVIADSYVIAEYLDELAGGGKLIPASGIKKWQVKTDHSILQGMLDALLLCRYEKLLRPEQFRWSEWTDDFRFPDCGWRKTFPKLNAFHERMMQRDSVKTTVPPPA